MIRPLSYGGGLTTSGLSRDLSCRSTIRWISRLACVAHSALAVRSHGRSHATFGVVRELVIRHFLSVRVSREIVFDLTSTSTAGPALRSFSHRFMRSIYSIGPGIDVAFGRRNGHEESMEFTAKAVPSATSQPSVNAKIKRFSATWCVTTDRLIRVASWQAAMSEPCSADIDADVAIEACDFGRRLITWGECVWARTELRPTFAKTGTRSRRDRVPGFRIRPDSPAVVGE